MGSMMPTMLLVKKVREAAKLGAWAMYKRMGKKSVQAYISLEKNAKRISPKDLYALEKIWLDEGCGTAEDFHALGRKLAEKEKA